MPSTVLVGCVLPHERNELLTFNLELNSAQAIARDEHAVVSHAELDSRGTSKCRRTVLFLVSR